MPKCSWLVRAIHNLLAYHITWFIEQLHLNVDMMGPEKCTGQLGAAADAGGGHCGPHRRRASNDALRQSAGHGSG